jgi:Uma2 family endonuclease
MAMPRTSQAANAETELADLEQLWEQLDLPGHRVELIGGQIIVSPAASRRHSTIVDALIDALTDVKRQHGWVIHTNLAVHIPATRERLIPDLMIAPRDAPGYGDSELLSPGVLLAAEVTSPSSQRQDHTAKARAYAQGQIPLYLLIDPLGSPATVTLLSGPDRDTYRGHDQAQAGQVLRLPEPFGINLDAAKLLA